MPKQTCSRVATVQCLFVSDASRAHHSFLCVCMLRFHSPSFVRHLARQLSSLALYAHFVRSIVIYPEIR